MAKSLGIKASDYVPLTSFTHHDFYKPFAIAVPDNRYGRNIITSRSTN